MAQTPNMKEVKKISQLTKNPPIPRENLRIFCTALSLVV